MQKVFGVLSLTVLFCVPLRAQVTPKFQVSGGYLFDSLSSAGASTSLHLNGGYGSLDYNVWKRIGAELQVSEGSRNQGNQGNSTLTTIMIGPQFYPFGHRHITPFAHVLFGGGYYRVSFPAYAGFPATTKTDSSVTWQAGAGIDVAVKRSWGIRLFEADYGHSSFFGYGASQSSYRIGVGFTYRFGGK